MKLIDVVDTSFDPESIAGGLFILICYPIKEWLAGKKASRHVMNVIFLFCKGVQSILI